MSNERGDFRFGPIAGIAVIALALVGLFAICNEPEGEVDGHVPLQLVSHEYDDGCWDGGCYGGERYDDGWGGGGSDGNTGYDGEGGRSGDMRQGDGRNCRNACDNTIIVPSPGGGQEEEQQR